MEVETLPPYPKEVYIPTDVALRDSLSKVVSSDLRTCTEAGVGEKGPYMDPCLAGIIKKKSEKKKSLERFDTRDEWQCCP